MWCFARLPAFLYNVHSKHRWWGKELKRRNGFRKILEQGVYSNGNRRFRRKYSIIKERSRKNKSRDAFTWSPSLEFFFILGQTIREQSDTNTQKVRRFSMEKKNSVIDFSRTLPTFRHLSNESVCQISFSRNLVDTCQVCTRTRHFTYIYIFSIIIDIDNLETHVRFFLYLSKLRMM